MITSVSSAVRQACKTAEEVVIKLGSLQSFIKTLNWPDLVFAEHLDHRLKLMAADMLEACAKRSEIGAHCV